MLIVHPQARNQGIGRALHDHALTELARTRGVARFQLGGAFPRVLGGPLEGGGEQQAWFARRGWGVRDAERVWDVVLDFGDWVWVEGGEGERDGKGDDGGVRFGSVDDGDNGERVLEFVDGMARRMGRMGWFDQYASTVRTGKRDVIVGVEKGEIVAAALTYTGSCGSQVSRDIPWAERIGDDVGGVTCICISGMLCPFFDLNLEVFLFTLVNININI